MNGVISAYTKLMEFVLFYQAPYISEFLFISVKFYHAGF